MEDEKFEVKIFLLVGEISESLFLCPFAGNKNKKIKKFKYDIPIITII